MKLHTLAACLILVSPITLAKQGFYLGTDQSVSFTSVPTKAFRFIPIRATISNKITSTM
ncbi:hypothetical protein K6U70_22050 [Vibrio vulnificus]|uniref:hypothetical protein n=1 Tax=Vibrio vulnificus TaxID=672 RepID=UPI001EEA0F38|nr:hypothetical protein [Vibrio vulnificus]MCG6274802.1 hypothetical protein [Vibrio vulnificus]